MLRYSGRYPRLKASADMPENTAVRADKSDPASDPAYDQPYQTFATLAIRKVVNTARMRSMVVAMLAFSAGIILSLAAFALSGEFWLALVTYAPALALQQVTTAQACRIRSIKTCSCTW